MHNVVDESEYKNFYLTASQRDVCPFCHSVNLASFLRHKLCNSTCQQTHYQATSKRKIDLGDKKIFKEKVNR